MHSGGFQFLLILYLWGISFHTVVVLGLGGNLLYKSILGRCDHVKNMYQSGKRMNFFFCPHYFSREMALSKTSQALIALPNYLISLSCYLSTTSLFLLWNTVTDYSTQHRVNCLLFADLLSKALFFFSLNHSVSTRTGHCVCPAAECTLNNWTTTAKRCWKILL